MWLFLPAVHKFNTIKKASQFDYIEQSSGGRKPEQERDNPIRIDCDKRIVFGVSSKADCEYLLAFMYAP